MTPLYLCSLKKKHVFICAFCLLTSVRTFGQLFTKTTTSVPGLTNSKSRWVDFNNDNKLDLFVTGMREGGSVQTSVFYYDGAESVSKWDFPPFADVAFDFGDFNNDTYVDIILTGTVGGTRQSLIYANVQGNGFAETDFRLTPISKGGVLWGDFDRDADLDLITTGLNNFNEPVTILYEYEGNVYAPRQSDLPDVSNGEIRRLNFLNDFSVDVLITGLNKHGNAVATVFSIDQDLNCHSFFDGIVGSAFNAIAMADINNDGFEDVLFSGLADEALTNTSGLYLNNTLSGFVKHEIPVPDLSFSSITAADMNNDGLTDIVITGEADTEPLPSAKTLYYINDQGNLSETLNSLPPVSKGDVSVADVDSDGDLDIFLSGDGVDGLQASLFLSDQGDSRTNQAPDPPTQLESTVSGNEVILSWNKAADDNTQSNNLASNLYISKSPDGNDLILSPNGDIGSGFNKLPGQTNVMLSNKAKFTLNEGRYYWSVQSVDTGLKGSAFAAEQSFVICDRVNLSDTSVCVGNAIELNAGTASDSVNWLLSDGSAIAIGTNQFTQTIYDDLTVVVEVTKQIGCTVRDTLIIFAHPLPVVDLGLDVEVCFGDSISVSSGYAVDSIRWYNANGLIASNGSSMDIKVTHPEVLVAQAVSSFNCANTDTVQITPRALPLVDIGPDQSYCKGDEINIHIASDWQEIYWYLDGINKPSSDASQFYTVAEQSGTVITKVVDAFSCTNTDTLRVQVLDLPFVDLGDDHSICLGDSISIQLATPFKFNTWHFNGRESTSNVESLSYQPYRTDTVSVSVIDNNNCENRDTLVINIWDLPVVDLGLDTAICFNNEILLQVAKTFSTVEWYFADRTNVAGTSWFFNHTAHATNTVFIKVTDDHGCVNYDSVAIQVLPLPHFNLGNDTTVCSEEEIFLAVEGAAKKVNWFNDRSLVLAEDTDKYSFHVFDEVNVVAEVFSVDGCVAYDTVRVSPLELPLFELGLDKTACHGDSIDLVISDEGHRYIWRDNIDTLAYGHAVTIPATETKTIALTAVDFNLCTFTDSLTVEVHLNPAVEIEAPSRVCEGEEADVIVTTPWETNRWYTDSAEIANDLASISQVILQTTTVFVAVTDLNQCTSIDSVTIRSNNIPVANAGSDTLICEGTSVVLGSYADENSDLSFEWTPSTKLSDALIAHPVATPLNSISYLLEVRSPEGCLATDTVEVVVNPKLYPDAGNNKSICIGDTIPLTASTRQLDSSITFQWMSDVGDFASESATVVVAPGTTTQYTLFVSTGQCEVEYDSIVVTVNSLPEIAVSEGQSIGSMGNALLFASGATHYQWEPAESLNDPFSPAPTASPLKSTTYTVHGTDGNGCENTASVEVLVQNNLFIPGLFTPNADGKNDTFTIYGSGIAFASLWVYDQQGNTMYHTMNLEEAINIGWDGFVNGRLANNGAYIWVIKGTFVNGEPLAFNGKQTGIIKLMK